MQKYFKDKKILIAWSIGFFLNLLTLALLIWRILPIKQEVVIHYNIYFGADRIGPTWQIFYIPILGFIIILANAVIGYYNWKRNKLLSYIFNYLSVFLQALLFIAGILLVLVNV